MKSGDASRGFEPGSSLKSRTQSSSLLARPAERGVVANFKLFILVVCSVMVKNSLFIHKHYTPDNSITTNENASSRNLTDTRF